MVATENTIEITVTGTPQGPDLASDELICVFYEPIASGMTTYRVLRHCFMTPTLLYFVAYSYNGGFGVGFENDVSKTSGIDVLKNLLGDIIVDSLLGNHIGKYRILFYHLLM